MRHCLHQVFVILFAGFFLFPVHAQTVNLTGTVKDSSTQQGVGNAVVKLSLQPLNVVTDSGGAYTLTNINAVLFGHGGDEVFMAPRFDHNSLFFGVVRDGEPVHIDLFCLSGRLAASLVNARLDRGNYQCNPFVKNPGSQIYIVKIQANGRTAMFRMPHIGTTTAASGIGLRRVGNGTAAAGFTKASSVLDTLIVSAAGYETRRKAITSYVGANDFFLAAGIGHAGNIMIENGSYQGCQSPMIVTVVDTDLIVASVPIFVKSTTDPKGFALALKKTPGSAGTYSDSVFFSIIKSDSARRTLRVFDGDAVVAYYAEASPARLDSTSTTWSGSVGTVDPGMSIYMGLWNKFTINAYDPDVSDSTLIVRVTSDKDTTGITATLHTLAGSPGSFTGKIGFTFAASRNDSLLSVMRTVDDNISIKYHDLTPAQDVVGSICTWKPFTGSVFFDTSSYHGTLRKAGIVLNDDDITDSTVVVAITSKKDPVGISDTLKASVGTPRSFTGEVGFTTSASTPGFISVFDNDSVTVSYQDDSPVELVSHSVTWNSN